VPATHKWYHRNGDNNVAELRAVLRSPDFKFCNEKQFLLVGGSHGGATALYYYYKHPEDVCGMVFLDPSTPDFYTRAVPIVKMGLVSAPYVYAIGAIIGYTGIFRLMAELFGPIMLPADLKFVFDEVPKEMVTYALSNFVSPRGMWGMSKEFSGFAEMCEQIREEGKRQIALGKKITVPVVCLTGLNWSQYDNNYGKIWQEVQYEHIVSRCEDAVQILLPNNNHPQVCVGEMKLVIASVDEVISYIQHKASGTA